jgi:hypothetical protein
MVSLGYLPSAARLTVVVIKARNLRVVDDTRTSSGIFPLCYTVYLNVDIFLGFILCSGRDSSDSIQFRPEAGRPRNCSAVLETR